MKTTDAYISTISPETRKKHNDFCKADYYKNRDRYKFTAKMNYYKKKFGYDIIDQFILKYGSNDTCILEIKKATKKTVKLELTEPV